MGAAPSAKNPPKAAAAPAPAASEGGKSIINSKYRDKYKEPDWLGKFILTEASLTKEVKKTVTDGEEKKTVTEKVNGGVDIDRLFTLLTKNGLSTEKLAAAKGSHGFEGRARMTARNMLQTVAKQRHGLFNVGGTFITAPKEFLVAKGAPDVASHKQDGTKIVIPKAEKPKEDTKKADATK